MKAPSYSLFISNAGNGKVEETPLGSKQLAGEWIFSATAFYKWIRVLLC